MKKESKRPEKGIFREQERALKNQKHNRIKDSKTGWKGMLRIELRKLNKIRESMKAGEEK